VLDRRPSDAEHDGELTFRGERLARLDQAKRDVAADLLSHVLVGAQLVNSLESKGRGSRPVGGTRFLNGHVQPPA